MRGGLVCLLVAVVFVAGCGDGDDEGGGAGAGVARGSYVGKVSGTDAFVALISNGRQVAGYVCDGKRISTWLGLADARGGEVELVSRKKQRLGTVSFDGESASGTVTAGGGEHRFTVTLATGEAGLYRKASGKPGKPGFRETGWIVLPGGATRGATNFIDPIGGFETQPAGKRTTSTKFIDPIGF